MAAKSLKPQGTWEVRRKFKLSRPPEPPDIESLTGILTGVEGIKAVSLVADRQVVVVRYDVTHTDYKSIIETLAATGFSPSDNWWNRRKAAWFQGLDLTGRENAAVKAPACCNKPPGCSGGGGYA